MRLGINKRLVWAHGCECQENDAGIWSTFEGLLVEEIIDGRVAWGREQTHFII